jgi:hypothetical protein
MVRDGRRESRLTIRAVRIIEIYFEYFFFRETCQRLIA